MEVTAKTVKNRISSVLSFRGPIQSWFFSGVISLSDELEFCELVGWRIIHPDVQQFRKVKALGVKLKPGSPEREWSPKSHLNRPNLRPQT